MTTKLDSLPPATRDRFIRAWNDPEVTQTDCLRRFGLGKWSAPEIIAALGPKATIGALKGEASTRRDLERQRIGRARRALLR